MSFQEYTNDVIAITVTLAGTAFAGYITYITGEIPDYFPMAFGMVIAFFFTRIKNGDKE